MTDGPKLQVIQVNELQRGDVIVVTIKEWPGEVATDEKSRRLDAIHRQMKAMFPAQQVLVVPPEISIEIKAPQPSTDFADICRAEPLTGPHTPRPYVEGQKSNDWMA